MIGKIREYMAKSPWVGWLVALLVFGAAVFIYFRRSGGAETYSVDTMTQMVTIKFTDTGEEVQIPRGRFEVQLRDRSGLIDKSQGMINPKTGAATGFLYNKSEWERTVERLNKEKVDAAKATGGPVPTMPEAPKDAAPPEKKN